jgi:hypothetical protein
MATVQMVTTHLHARVLLDGRETRARTTLMIATKRIVGTVCAWTESTRTRASALPDGMVQIARTTLMTVSTRIAQAMVRVAMV